MGGITKSIGGVLKSAGQAVGLVPQSEQNINTGFLTGGFQTPGFNLALGGKRTPTTLTSRGGFTPEEQAIQSGLQSNLTGVAGLRARLAPLQASAQSLQGLFPGYRQRAGALGQQVQGLLGQVQPGFGRLTESQVDALRQREARDAGNLRAALTQRNLNGSSFAQSVLQRTSLDFAREEERVRSEAFIQEMAVASGFVDQAAQLLSLEGQFNAEEAANLGVQAGLTAQNAQIFAQELNNLQQQQALLAQSIQARLQELGVTGNIANGVQAMITDIFQQNAAFAAGASLQQQSNLLGTIGGVATTPFGGGGSLLQRGLGSIFG